MSCPAWGKLPPFRGSGNWIDAFSISQLERSGWTNNVLVQAVTRQFLKRLDMLDIPIYSNKCYNPDIF